MEVNFELDDFFVFLDVLRESGEINMFGAPRELQNEFGLSSKKHEMSSRNGQKPLRVDTLFI